VIDKVYTVLNEMMTEYTERWAVLQGWSVVLVDSIESDWIAPPGFCVGGITWRPTKTIYVLVAFDRTLGDAFRHEVAHAISKYDGHGKHWQQAARLLGVDPWYWRKLQKAIKQRATQHRSGGLSCSV